MKLEVVTRRLLPVFAAFSLWAVQSSAQSSTLQSAATGINEWGQVVGWSQTPSGGTRAWVWANGVMQGLDTPGRNSAAMGINNWGQIVGYVELANGIFHAFLWEHGSARDLGSLGGTSGNSVATAINDLGDIVGWSSAPGPGPGFARAFWWRDGAMRDLGNVVGEETTPAAINERREIVGAAVNALGFLLRNGSVTRITVGSYFSTFPQGINNRGQITGYASLPGRTRAFLYERGEITELGTLGGEESMASAINWIGQIAGSSSLADGRMVAFRWERGTMISLGTLGGRNSAAKSINNAGQIVGQAELPNGIPHAFLWERGRMIDLGAVPR